MRRFKVLCFFSYRTKLGRERNRHASLMVRVERIEDVAKVFKRTLLDQIALGQWTIWGEPYEFELDSYLPERSARNNLNRSN